jgi:molybdopterin converting factor small subunit
MATVYIPALLRKMTGGRPQLEVEGATVRDVIDNLDRICPGMRESLLESNQLRSNISVAVDGEVSPLGLLEKVGKASEVHFVAAIKGGKGERGVASTICDCGEPRGHADHASPGHGIRRDAPQDARRVQVAAHGNPCDSQKRDRRGHKNDQARDTTGRRR